MLAALSSPSLARAADDAVALSPVWGLALLLAGGVAGFILGRRTAQRGARTGSATTARDESMAALATLNHQLEDSHRRYLEMVESVNEVIFRTDSDGRLVFLNGFWRKLSGYSIDQSLGRPLLDFLHPDDFERARRTLRDLIAGTITDCHSELRLRTSGGEIRWVEMTGRRLVDNGTEGAGIAGTVDDISARKVAELTLRNLNQELELQVRARTAELEGANRELEAFSYSVSHDLRAPLRAIDGFARILEEELGERLDERLRGHFSRIRKATERMALLIDALINLALLTRQPLRKENVDLSELAAQVIDELHAGEPERKVEVEITRGLSVTADRALMHALLDNLLRNAWKFTARQPNPRIVFRAEREHGRRVFCVEDNGAGFDMAYAGNLFRPFTRLHASADYPGTGIGLATVQRIIQRHEGSIWVDARPNEGSRFRFTLGH
jgi:PAS domain S-box-containing protein